MVSAAGMMNHAFFRFNGEVLVASGVISDLAQECIHKVSRDTVEWWVAWSWMRSLTDADSE